MRWSVTRFCGKLYVRTFCERSPVPTCARRSRLLDLKVSEQEAARSRERAASCSDTLRSSRRERRAQVGTGDRSQKVRTYNFPQNRVTDHRIHFSTHSVDQVLDGKLDDLIAAVKQAQEKEQLSA